MDLQALQLQKGRGFEPREEGQWEEPYHVLRANVLLLED
jgi:hypothetical protein